MTLASSIGSVINGVSNTEVSWLSRGKVPALNSKRTRARSSSTSSVQNQPSKLSLGLQHVKEEADSLSSSRAPSPGVTASPTTFASNSLTQETSANDLSNTRSLDPYVRSSPSSPNLSRSRTISAPEFKTEREKLAKEQSPGFKKTWLNSFSKWRSGKEDKKDVAKSPSHSKPQPHIASHQTQQAVPKAAPTTQTTTTTCPDIAPAPATAASPAAPSPKAVPVANLPTSPPRTASPRINVEAVAIPDKPTANVAASSPAVASSIASSASTDVGSPKGFLLNTLRRFSKSQPANAAQCPPSRVLNKNAHRANCAISGLEGVSSRRVSFDINTYHSDPPQQIPARKPKKGNVEVGADGLLRKNGVVIQTPPPQAHEQHHFNPFNSGVGQPRKQVVQKVPPTQTNSPKATPVAVPKVDPPKTTQTAPAKTSPPKSPGAAAAASTASTASAAASTASTASAAASTASTASAAASASSTASSASASSASSSSAATAATSAASPIAPKTSPPTASVSQTHAVGANGCASSGSSTSSNSSTSSSNSLTVPSAPVRASSPNGKSPLSKPQLAVDMQKVGGRSPGGSPRESPVPSPTTSGLARSNSGRSKFVIMRNGKEVEFTKASVYNKENTLARSGSLQKKRSPRNSPKNTPVTGSPRSASPLAAKVPPKPPSPTKEAPKEAPKTSPPPGDEEVPSISNLIIDTPLKTSHEMYDEKDESDEDNPLDVDVEKLYTRCCHLREILPIPATLKQIKAQKAPLSLRLMNPRPTLIEIQSFADFVAVAPVSTLVLDNVTLTPDMFSLLFAAMSASQWLEKLSLRNTAIDEVSWKRLCYLLAMTSKLVRLDLSHQMKRDKDKEFKRTPPTVDWKLLCDALQYGKGMEELVLNGCLVPSEVFEHLMLGACRNTKRLGLAFNDLGPDEMHFVGQWMAGECEGLDIGGNHLTYVEEPEGEDAVASVPIAGAEITALDVLLDSLSDKLNLRFLSLNSTHLEASPTTEKLITALSKMQNLRFLDLSSNSGLFPSLTTHLCKALPLFPDLRRIHLDYCDLSPRDVVQISDALAQCKSLLHVSLVGNTRMDRTCVAALTVAVRVSKSIYLLDLEQSLVPKMEQRRIVHYCMRNMERLVYGKATSENEIDHEIEVGEDNRDIFDVGKDIASTVDDILEFNQETCQVSDMLLQRAYHVKTRVQKVMDELFAKRNNGELTYEDKELLVRYCFLDATLNETLQNFEKQRKGQAQGPSVHPLTHMMGLAGNEPQIKAPDLQVEGVGEARPALSRNSSSASVQARRQELEEGEFHKWGTFVMQVRENEPLLHAGRPSGDDLRKAILNATGVGTVSELIGDIIHSGVDVEELLNISGLDQYRKALADDGSEVPMEVKAERDAIDSFLEDLARVRSR
ncbi:HMG2-induced ER-remodeling protein 1 [Yarrowia sp. B02]|nr:HMG2-induced ER-remodeling protein 1 [Yarrowia sp. B02]